MEKREKRGTVVVVGGDPRKKGFFVQKNSIPPAALLGIGPPLGEKSDLFI